MTYNLERMEYKFVAYNLERMEYKFVALFTLDPIHAWYIRGCLGDGARHIMFGH